MKTLPLSRKSSDNSSRLDSSRFSSLSSPHPLFTPHALPPPPSPLLFAFLMQAWDNIYGNNWKWMKKTGFAAVGAASAISLVCTFTEFEEDKKKIGN